MHALWVTFVWYTMINSSFRQKFFYCLCSSNSISASRDDCHAAASAAAWSCRNSVAIAELEDTAEALAEATAEAISLAYAHCEVDTGGYVCASASSSISVWVDAVARAWAEAWAVAIQCKNRCSLNVEDAVDAVGTILVKAATDAYTYLCTGVPPIPMDPMSLLAQCFHGVILMSRYAWQVFCMLALLKIGQL
jgi:hypothetical protein